MGPLSWTKATELNVITNKLLIECALKTYCDTEEAKRIVREEGLNFLNIRVLNLESKNILKIINVEQLKNLKKLYLSNNFIEKIEKLGELTNLVCLDLSFNQIETICGLENLRNLTDLSLSNNRIKKVENLENLEKLELLSLKDNQISDYVDVKYFFSFGSLRSVCFKGNPIQEDKNYQYKIIAFIPSLLYLDFKLITQEKRKESARICGKELEKLIHEDQVQKEKESSRIEQERMQMLYMDASLEGMGEFLDQILNSHELAHRLFMYPALSDMFDEFCASFDSTCGEWLQQGMKNYEMKTQEVRDFSSCSKRLVVKELSSIRKHLNDFQELKRNVLLRMGLLNQSSEEDIEEDKEIEKNLIELASYLNQEIKEFWKLVMTLEMELSAKIHKIENVFQAYLTELTENFQPKVTDFYTRLQTSYDNFMERVTNFFAEWYEKSSDEKQQAIRIVESNYGDLDSEMIELLENDEDIDRILKECATVHKSMIQEKYTSLQDHLKSWLVQTVNKHLEGEMERHRQRIIEIMLYCRYAEKELEEMCHYCAIPGFV